MSMQIYYPLLIITIVHLYGILRMATDMQQYYWWHLSHSNYQNSYILIFKNYFQAKNYFVANLINRSCMSKNRTAFSTRTSHCWRAQYCFPSFINKIIGCPIVAISACPDSLIFFVHGDLLAGNWWNVWFAPFLLLFRISSKPLNFAIRTMKW